MIHSVIATVTQNKCLNIFAYVFIAATIIGFTGAAKNCQAMLVRRDFFLYSGSEQRLISSL